MAPSAVASPVVADGIDAAPRGAPTSFGANINVVICYVVVFAMWVLPQFVLIPVPINIVTTATALVYLGSHRSLRLRDKAHPENQDNEVITKEDAYKFPILGSAMLFGLYALVKYVDEKLVAKLLAAYFGLLGAATLGGTLTPVVGVVLTGQSKFGKKFHLPVLGEVDLTFTIAELISMFIGVGLSVYYTMTKHWAANNLIGMSFCVQALERISLGNFTVGAILLCGLFFYDIFWVFGTEVMVTVAKKINGPIKLLFPRVLAHLVAVVPTADGEEPKEVKNQFSMLGLGDIVIPGIFIALLLRFDATQRGVAPEAGEHSLFARPTFNAGIFGYVAGLSMTIFVMYKFDAAQPALLYLVPSCLLSSILTALATKSFKALIAYSEEDEEKKDEKAVAAETKKEN